MIENLNLLFAIDAWIPASTIALEGVIWDKNYVA
jgi:hypothetical protein